MARQTRQVSVESPIYDLKNPDPVRRREAAKLLGDNKVKRAVPDLVAVANDSDPSVRRAVINALSNMGDIRALPAFVAQTGDAEQDIRSKCIESIVDLYLPGESGLSVSITKVANFFNPWSDEWADMVVEPDIKVDPSVVPALRSRLADPEDGIRIKSCRAIGILKGREALPALVEILQKDASNNLRFETIRSIRKIGDPSATRALMNYLAYSDPKVRNEAVLSVGSLRYQPAAAELMRLYEKESAKPSKLIDQLYRQHLLNAIALIADPASKELFVKEKMNPDDGLRLHAVEGLARLGDPSMATTISRDWLNEKDARLQTAQSFALYRMGRKEYMDDLAKRLGNSRTGSEARQYLTELRPAELPDLYAQVRNRDIDVREGLAEIIGIVGDKDAIPVLQELSKDTRGQVAPLANRGLRRVRARLAGS